MIIRNYYTITFIILFTLFTNSSYSQQNEDLIGDWKITKVDLKPSAGEEEKQMLVMLSQIFSKSTFHFKNNNLFSFDSPDKDLAIKEANWKFDSIKKYIKVTERVTKGNPGQLMGITVKLIEGQYLFLMEESPIILTVVKK
jgi:hypothetical protein